jgi:hypothetical protein
MEEYQCSIWDKKGIPGAAVGLLRVVGRGE